jgi:hypothetical protein
MRAIRCVVAGLLAAGIVAMVGAQQPGRPGGGQFDINNVVLSNKALQEELKLTDAQKEKFKAQADKAAELFKGMGTKFKDAAGDKDKLQEIFASMKKEGEKLGEETKKLVDETLTADQKKRLHQISIQMKGVSAFADEEVQKALSMSDSQKTKIKDVVSEYSKDRDAIRQDIFGDAKGGKAFFDQEKQKEFREKTGKLSKEVTEKVEGMLDDNQKKAWKELVGAPFDTTQLFQGGFRPGGKGKDKE